jgi:phosphohistidine swiveling domain-containing protein
MPYILHLAALNRSDLPRAGGKGANLGEMCSAGLPVPPGFCILTNAYRDFVTVNHLDEVISRECAAADAADPASLESASAAIRVRFEGGHLPPGLAEEISAAYLNFWNVAVRSSATAEDLPELSFAGQQDTYLNVVGENSLLKAVVRCWGSLWTARAIGYRARNGIPHGEVALAVVVQAMIPSEAAGVLFTVNPLNGKRTETVIDATLGLGEALVSGKVEPDHYVVVGGKITEKRLGAKALSIRGLEGGGTQTVSEQAAEVQALPDEAILELARLGQQAADHFGSPQDVEWSWAERSFWLVQSRPVTSLFPLPEHPRGPDHLMVLMNFGAVQGVMDPIMPLGRDVFFKIVLSVANVFGSKWGAQTQTLVYEAAERLFLDINGALRHSTGRKMVMAFLPAVEPGSIGVLTTYLDDPRLAVRESRWKLGTRLHLLRALGPNVLRVIANLLFPASRRKRIQAKIEGVVRGFKQERGQMASDPAQAAAFVEHALWQMPQRMLLWLVGAVVSGQVGFQGLRRLVDGLPDGDRLALEVMRGMPHNVTTEMDLALWNTAHVIQQDADGRAFFEAHPAQELAAVYQAGGLPPAAQAAVEKFMHIYGVRGVGEIDLGRKRWREDPTPVMQSLSSYLKIERPEAAPDAVFGRGAGAAQTAIEDLQAQLRALKGGWWKAPLASWLAQRARELAGLRETPKFTIIRIFGEMRAALLDAGTAWAAAGWLERAEDVGFLRLDEIDRLGKEAAGQAGETSLQGGPELAKTGWRKLVSDRQAAYAHEQQRRQSPRLLLGDGTAVYEGVGGYAKEGDTVLLGSPVSSGQVEGRVHVVLDPFGARLSPGEILVCPGTDPAWTPLFLAAGGLVMDVGGLMTHGSVVAREYGIPAVVGVGQATLLLQTGMHVRVDGSAGTVTILDSLEAVSANRRNEGH